MNFLPGIFLRMYFINKPDAAEHQNADSVSVHCKQPAKFPSNLQSKHQNKPQNKLEPSSQAHSNVILFAAASKPARGIEAANFKYPMLECS
jgi:hypothetical protein